MTITFPTDGRKILIPYVTGAVTRHWTEYLLAYQEAGADALEIGLPFSDPMLDGPTIQAASDLALTRGATPERILTDLATVRPHLHIPTIVMTYANLARRLGPPHLPAADTGDSASSPRPVAAGSSHPVGARAGGGAGSSRLVGAGADGVADLSRLAAAGVNGLIVPDLPLEESAATEAAAASAGIDLILLAAPSTPPARLREIVLRSRGFVYAVSTMGTTGERATLDPQATALAARIRSAQVAPALPVLIGFGVSTPEQAALAGRAGDGVVVASALMRRVLDGATPADLAGDVAALRRALDEGDSPATPHAEVPGDRR